MQGRILIVFSTETEASDFRALSGCDEKADSAKIGDWIIEILVTGVGAISMSWSLMNRLHNNPLPDLVINAGIAGTFSEKLDIGDVAIVTRECFGDLGMESGSDFIKITDTKLLDGNNYPFSEGFIYAKNDFLSRIPSKYMRVSAVTVNTVSGTERTIEILKNHFSPDIETMESATFFYICAKMNLPFLGIRAISNRVEPGRGSWNIPLATARLAGSLKEIVLTIF